MTLRAIPRCLILILLIAVPAAAQNVVQLENRKPGATDWDTFPEANGEIEGYASATSVNRGGTISFYVNTTEPSYTLQIFRVGWYNGLGARKVLGPVTRTGIRQTTPPPDANGMVECNWTSPYTITVPNSSDP
ncbi:MAG: hypothetical protein JWO56_2134, partial [Acidobacteria bacterium]|nr:hypothetical protein [Acidobacteriota bacterium]